MSNILDFSKAPRVVEPRRPNSGGRCEVIIFPGVRRERKPEQPVKDSAAGPKKTRRR
jgi:hypothetical protein